MAEVQGSNLYEINKQLSSQEKLLTSSRRKMRFNSIQYWFEHSIDQYAMLLCHERRDYTIFNLVSSPAPAAHEAATALFECLDNRGKIVSIDKVEETDAWEIWLRIYEDKTKEDYCYYLFNYDAAVIEC